MVDVDSHVMINVHVSTTPKVCWPATRYDDITIDPRVYEHIGIMAVTVVVRYRELLQTRIRLSHTGHGYHIPVFKLLCTEL
jgi:hypothetical protein